MKDNTGRTVPLAALALLLVTASPLAYASTLTVNLTPKSGLARVDSTSSTKIVFTYPAGSTVSSYLENMSSNYSLSGNFGSGVSGVGVLQGVFDQEDSHISVRNVSVSMGYVAKGNATSLVVDKTTNITAWISGAFSVVNGSVVANLGWRAFTVRGPMEFDMGDRMVDVNLVGSTMQESLGAHALAAGFLMGAFGGGPIWSRPTLNFTALNSPLSTWTKNYDSATNTTTFTKTIAGSSTFMASIDYGNAKYSLSASSDPTGVVTVQGYANASGDSLVIVPAPPSAPTMALAVGAVIAVVAALGGYLAIKRGVRPKAPLAR